jgi:hypothetical protein
MAVVGRWTFVTAHGAFHIVPVSGGRFEARFEDEGLGSYFSPEQALDDLVGGHTFSPSSGIDPSEVGLPDQLSDWTFVRWK